MRVNEKRNLRNRIYIKRTEFRKFIQDSPREIRDQILAYFPIPEEILNERDKLFLDKIIPVLKEMDHKNAYEICTKGPFSKTISNFTKEFIETYYKYKKFDSFPFIPSYEGDSYDYWINHSEEYYKLFGVNDFNRRQIVGTIVEILKKSKKDESKIFRKQLLAVKFQLSK
uniref:Uncharacterized protein n=1 Tax=viral metagenome TaxID=1070528 RepID=A0A6C0KUW8_9ZZZZ